VHGTSMRLGGSPYVQYDDMPFELSDDTHVPAALLRLRCARSGEGDSVCGGGECGCSKSRALMLVTPLVFLKNFWAFVEAGGGVCDNRLHTDMNPVAISDLLVYEHFGVDIVDPIIRPAYEENMHVFTAQCTRVYNLHPQLACVSTNVPGSRWWRAVVQAGGAPQPTQQYPAATPAATPAPTPAQTPALNTAPGSCMPGSGVVVEGAWMDMVYSMPPPRALQPRAQCRYQHPAPNKTLQRDMAVLVVHTNDLIRAYQNMQPHHRRGQCGRGDGEGGVRARLRIMLSLIDECLCGKFLEEFRTRITPGVLCDMRAAIDMHAPTQSLHQGLFFFLYQSLAYLLHYTVNVRALY